MNKRIKQLAEQAGADFMRRINYNNLEGKEYEEDAGVIFESNESFKKFAELIVEECIEQVWYTREDGINGNVSQVIKDRIREHFGVE